MRTHLISKVAAAAALALGLSACGGNDGDSVAAPTVPSAPTSADDIPVSATASARAFATFASGLAPSESAAPLNIDASTPPVSETEEPLAI